MNIPAFWERPWFKSSFPINLFGIAGRSTRRQFAVSLVLTVLMVVTIGIENSENMRLAAMAFGLAILVTAIIRRFHDCELPMWWIISGLVPYIGWGFLLFTCFQSGTHGRNKYGPDPRGRTGWND